MIKDTFETKPKQNRKTHTQNSSSNETPSNTCMPIHSISQVGEKRLYSNKCLLCYNSTVFREQLLGDGKGKASKGSKDLDLSEKRYDDVCELLAFIDPRVDTNLTGKFELYVK